MSGSRSGSKGDAVGTILFAIFALAFSASPLWTDNKEILFRVALGGIGIGLLTSIFYVVQVDKAWDPWPIEDTIIVVGGLVACSFAFLTAWLSVRHPLYTEPTDIFADFCLPVIHLGQLAGMFPLYLGISILAIMQGIVGNVHRKRRQRGWCNRTEEAIEKWRVGILIVVGVLLFLAFLLGTGVLFHTPA